jgi:hypothetical protein
VGRGRHLAGLNLDIALDPFTDQVVRVARDGVPVPYGLCDVRANARQERAETSDAAPTSPTDRFQRIARLLRAARRGSDET